jgi:hypothetical protein
MLKLLLGIFIFTTYVYSNDNCFVSTKHIFKNKKLVIGKNIELTTSTCFYNGIIQNKKAKVFIKKGSIIKDSMITRNKKLIINFNNKIVIELKDAILIEKQVNSFKIKINKKIQKIKIDGEIN